MPDRLCLLSVHAHPDDESSKGASTVARYGTPRECTRRRCAAREARRGTSSIRPWTPPRSGRISAGPTARAGRHRHHWLRRPVMLGYRDSGMPGTPRPTPARQLRPGSARRGGGRLVTIIRRERPQVIVTYPEGRTNTPIPIIYGSTRSRAPSTPPAIPTVSPTPDRRGPRPSCTTRCGRPAVPPDPREVPRARFGVTL